MGYSPGVTECIWQNILKGWWSVSHGIFSRGDGVYLTKYSQRVTECLRRHILSGWWMCCWHSTVFNLAKNYIYRYILIHKIENPKIKHTYSLIKFLISGFFIKLFLQSHWMILLYSIAMSTILKRKQIFSSIVGKFWYQNETTLFISQWLTIEAKQTEVALNYSKNEAKQQNLFQFFLGAKQNNGCSAKTSKSLSKTNWVSLERWIMEAN